MCASKANGGQRCSGHAKKALDKAHAKKIATVEAFHAAKGAPVAEREALLRKGIAAEDAYEDALARYASTPKGRADLEARKAAAPGYHSAYDRDSLHQPDDYMDLEMALATGASLRRTATEIRMAVKSGELDKEGAIERSNQYPPQWVTDHRAKQAERTVARVIHGRAA